MASGLALAALGLLAAISVDVGIPGQSLLQSLRFHIVAAMLVLPVLLLALGARWRGGLLLLVLLASLLQGLWPIWDGYQRRFAGNGAAVVGSLSLMSFNVLATNDRGAELGAFIAGQGMDVVLTMETSGVAPALDALRTAYPHSIGCGPQDRCDTALFSRLPLLRAEIRALGEMERDRLVIAEIEVAGQTVTIVGLHLSKPYFDNMADFEIWQVARALRGIDGPIVLAGDFNAAPWSDALVWLVRQAELVPPPFAQATWPVRAGPLGVPIDNMFSRGPALITDLAALPDSYGSNHRGLVARIDILAN